MMTEKLTTAYDFAKKYIGEGKVADYIPELSYANPNHLGVAVTDLNGITYATGDSKELFTIQSISKLITLIVALEEKGRVEVLERTGMEATGDAFNSILRLETSPDGVPFNPMINAGAISVCTLIEGDDHKRRIEKILIKSAKLLNDKKVDIDDAIYQSESLTGDRNRALAYLMRNSGVFGGDVEEHLKVYFSACSMLVNAENLSFLGAVLANDGICPKTKIELVSRENAKLVRAMMVVAGMYDGSGSFAANIGFPAKSGVGGGICGAVTKRLGIGVFSPALDSKGNSLCGLKVIENLAKNMDLFIY